MYALYPFSLQEIAMPSVIMYMLKSLFISCKKHSNKWLDDAITIYFHVLAPPHGT